MAKFTIKSTTDELAVLGVGNEDGIQGETTNPTTFSAGVRGVASNTGGLAAGVIGEGKGSGPGVFGQAIKDAGVIGFRGDPKLSQTTVSNDAGRAGVFGASDDGAGVLGYARNPASWAVYAFGGLKAIALGRPFAAEFVGDIKVDGDVILTGADCAEQFDSDALGIEPGTVMVIGPDGLLRRSEEAYDTRAAGVVAGAGTYRPGIVLDGHETGECRLSISLVGKVFCKVDSRYADIGVGDLLTTSPTPGHAMKATDPTQAFGAIIGKSLRPWEDGPGLIPILVALG